MPHFEGSSAVSFPVKSVSQVTLEIKLVLEGALGREAFWIAGEVSNYKGRNYSGHLYFNLKDSFAVLPAVCFKSVAQKLSSELAEGMQVVALGRVSLYEPQGRYQFVIEELRPAGFGQLHLRFEALKKKLEAEGLFQPSRKRPLPFLPKRIGLITSPSGAAIRDMLNGIHQRWPHAAVLVFPVHVQGQEAVPDIVEAFLAIEDDPSLVDVVIVGRGGGSIEDLWAFNEEPVARIIANCPVPVISAVGHMTDFTIADFVADVRASTPSNAAELVVPELTKVVAMLHARKDLLISRISRQVQIRQQRIDLRQRMFSQTLKGQLQRRLLQVDSAIERLIAVQERSIAQRRLTIERAWGRSQSARQHLSKGRRRLEDLSTAIVQGMERCMLTRRNALLYAGTVLTNNDRRLLLRKGYCIARSAKGKILRTAKSVNPGDAISIELGSGTLETTAVRVQAALE